MKGSAYWNYADLRVPKAVNPDRSGWVVHHGLALALAKEVHNAFAGKLTYLREVDTAMRPQLESQEGN